MGCHVSCKIITVHLFGFVLGALLIVIAVYDTIFNCLNQSISSKIECIATDFVYLVLGIFCVISDIAAPNVMIKHFYFYFTYIGRSFTYFIVCIPLITSINVTQIGNIITQQFTSFDSIVSQRKLIVGILFLLASIWLSIFRCISHGQFPKKGLITVSFHLHMYICQLFVLILLVNYIFDSVAVTDIISQQILRQQLVFLQFQLDIIDVQKENKNSNNNKIQVMYVDQLIHQQLNHIIMKKSKVHQI